MKKYDIVFTKVNFFFKNKTNDISFNDVKQYPKTTQANFS